MFALGLDDDEWLPQRICLIDNSPALANAWRDALSRFPEFQVLKGDYFQQTSDAIVSPASSFGITDGGLDLAIRNTLGYSIQGKVQEVIVHGPQGPARPGGDRPVRVDSPISR